MGWWKVWKRLCKQHGRWHLKPWCPTGDPGIPQTPWVPRAAFTWLCKAEIGPWRSCCLSQREVQVMGSGKHKEGGRSALAGIWGWCLGRERAAPCKGIWGEDGLCWDWVNPACFTVFSRITLLQAGVCPRLWIGRGVCPLGSSGTSVLLPVPRQLCSSPALAPCPTSRRKKELHRDAVKPPFAVLQGAIGSRVLTSILLVEPVWLICAGQMRLLLPRVLQALVLQRDHAS